MAKKVPGFMFFSYREAAYINQILVTQESYQRVITDAAREVASYFNVPFSPPSPLGQQQKLFVRLHNPDKQSLDAIINGIRNFIKDDFTIVFNVPELIQSVHTAVDLLNIFFGIVAVITVVLCFFGLWLSFDANVRENSWEFGVLRAIGLSSGQVIRVYIYEGSS